VHEPVTKHSIVLFVLGFLPHAKHEVWVYGIQAFSQQFNSIKGDSQCGIGIGNYHGNDNLKRI
jgi:hypothetical protein